MDGTPGPGATSIELRSPPERNHLSETRGDGPTRPVTVSPWPRSILRRRIDPSIVFTRWKPKVQSLQRPQEKLSRIGQLGCGAQLAVFVFGTDTYHFHTTCPHLPRGHRRAR